MGLENYIPINYEKWVLGNEARKGVNLKRLEMLTREELEIWEESVPFQDQRKDPGHGEMVTYFALNLLDYMPGERKIVIPASMFHDTGWFGNDPDAWKKLVDASKEDVQALDNEANRRPHQNRGILIAGRILEKTGYFKRNSIYDGFEIADFIGDHDTKKLPATKNGKIVRTADLLWRVTYPVVKIYMADETQRTIFERMKKDALSEKLIPYLGDVGTKIAKIELANTMLFGFPNQAEKILKDEFSEEMKYVTNIKKYS